MLRIHPMLSVWTGLCNLCFSPVSGGSWSSGSWLFFGSAGRGLFVSCHTLFWGLGWKSHLPHMPRNESVSPHRHQGALCCRSESIWAGMAWLDPPLLRCSGAVYVTKLNFKFRFVCCRPSRISRLILWGWYAFTEKNIWAHMSRHGYSVSVLCCMYREQYAWYS